jgi:hypothetical protein
VLVGELYLDRLYKLPPARKLKERVLVGELYLDRLYKLPLRQPIAREISRFQPVRRDFSLVLDESIVWEKIDRAVAGLQIPELVEWRAREVFRDRKLGVGEYSLLLGVTFQAADRTLREEELQSFQARVVEAVGKVGARLRSYAGSWPETGQAGLYLQRQFECREVFQWRSFSGSRRLWTRRREKKWCASNPQKRAEKQAR